MHVYHIDYVKVYEELGVPAAGAGESAGTLELPLASTVVVAVKVASAVVVAETVSITRVADAAVSVTGVADAVASGTAAGVVSVVGAVAAVPVETVPSGFPTMTERITDARLPSETVVVYVMM